VINTLFKQPKREARGRGINMNTTRRRAFGLASLVTATLSVTAIAKAEAALRAPLDWGGKYLRSAQPER
jgi:hypothetical protein